MQTIKQSMVSKGKALHFDPVANTFTPVFLSDEEIK
jgi:hypothetical protein